jgi:hypothetical protein
MSTAIILIVSVLLLALVVTIVVLVTHRHHAAVDPTEPTKLLPPHPPGERPPSKALTYTTQAKVLLCPEDEKNCQAALDPKTGAPIEVTLAFSRPAGDFTVTMKMSEINYTFPLQKPTTEGFHLRLLPTKEVPRTLQPADGSNIFLALNNKGEAFDVDSTIYAPYKNCVDIYFVINDKGHLAIENMADGYKCAPYLYDFPPGIKGFHFGAAKLAWISRG